MKIDPNAPAFPKAHVINAPHNTGWVYADHAEDGTPFAPGLTIRAELASRAMQGMLAAETGKEAHSIPSVARIAVAYADALISELNKEQA